MIDQHGQPQVDFGLVRFDHLASGLGGERVYGHSAAVDVAAGAIPVEDLFGPGHSALDHESANHAAGFEYLIGDLFLREAGEMVLPGDVVGDGDDRPAAHRVAGFVHMNGGVAQTFEERCSQPYDGRLIDVADLFDDQLPVEGEVLNQLRVGGEGYHRHLVVLFQPLQRQQGARLNLLENGADAAAQIHQQNYRKRKPVLAEMRDLLSDAVFEEFKIGGFQPVDDPSGLPVERLRVDYDQIGAQPDALCKNNFALRRVLDCGLRIADCGFLIADRERQNDRACRRQ